MLKLALQSASCRIKLHSLDGFLFLGFGCAQASESVKHLMLPCHYSQRAAVATDVIRCYAAMGRAIVFTDTKRDADDLSHALAETLTARPLHGDIPQHQREVCACRQGAMWTCCVVCVWACASVAVLEQKLARHVGSLPWSWGVGIHTFGSSLS